MMKKQTLLLIDGSSYFFRAFHALPPLTNSKGSPTGAVYGVLNMIRSTLKEYQPDYVACVFDAKGKTFRDDLYPLYKANREETPVDLAVQFQPMVDILEAMGMPLLVIDGVEADDVIGTLCKQASRQNIKTIVSTGDKDMAQLVNDDVMLVNTMSKKEFNRDGVIEKFEIPPELIVDYLTLIGDKVDNIPGVDKVGPKTAVKWLKQYGSLDNILHHANDIPGKVGENLRQAMGQLPLSKQLVTLNCDVPLNITVTDLVQKESDRVALINLYQSMEFRSWLSELLESEPSSKEQAMVYETIWTEKQLLPWLNQLSSSKQFTIDTETTDLNVLDAELVGLSFTDHSGKAAYLPLMHDYPDAPEQMPRDRALALFKPLLEDPNILKIGQNIKYDIGIFENYNITLKGVGFDTMLESYVLNSTVSRHDMDSLALKYLGKKTIHFEDIAGKGPKQKHFNEIEVDVAANYSAEDADITQQLHEKLWPMISENAGLRYTFEKIEMPLVKILSKMERHGVFVDSALLKVQSSELGKRIDEIERQAYEAAGEHFNLASPKQLATILYEKMGLPILQKTPTGLASTGESVLQDLALDYPLPKLILEHRTLAKLKSTYADSLPKQVHPKTQRVHTSYNQAVTATGRLSSTDPNLQNIPVKTPEGRRIRQAFIAPKGMKIVSADYSQIELRIIAHLSDDPGLKKAFADGLDIHRATASEVFGIAFDNVTDLQRRHAKAINFGLIYGMSSYGLAKQLGIERAEAEEYMNLYFHRYPNVKEYMNDMRTKAHKLGYVETVCGRRLYLPEINTRNLQRQRAAERAAINAPMQGTASDIIKLAMIDLDRWTATTAGKAEMIMQVHDELVFEVAESFVETAISEITKRMNHAIELSVPLEVHVGVGDNWDEAH